MKHSFPITIVTAFVLVVFVNAFHPSHAIIISTRATTTTTTTAAARSSFSLSWPPSLRPLSPLSPSIVIRNNLADSSVSDASSALDESKPTKDDDEEGKSPPSNLQANKISTEGVVLAQDLSWEDRVARVKRMGGPFTIMTPVGALTPYGIYCGITSIVLGLIWYVQLSLCNLFYFVTRNRVDTLRRLPNFFTQIWGTLVLTLTRGWPEYVNMEILKKFYKTKRTAMFVANHNSWQDIPFLGSTVGWRNYKIIAKKELEKIPILSSAITTGKHVVLDRSNKRSQFMALKQGIHWLENGVHLCTFPEGTRSKTGRMNEFKNGAFKVAHKVGVPVIPLSIVAAGDIMPFDFMFPLKTARGVKVIVHEPIESQGKTEEELASAAREAIISGLPENQRPLE